MKILIFNLKTVTSQVNYFYFLITKFQMSLGPFLRTPFTDLTGSLINHQQYDKCGEREMNMMDCLEAYGMDRGQRKCVDLIRDFQECAGMKKQLMRFHVSFFSLKLF